MFDIDIACYEKKVYDLISNSAFLVIDGAGSIGQAVTKEIFKRNPKKLNTILY
ncbi:MAG: hypothetical protein ACTTJC_05855 [Campylobacter sp.]